LADTGETFGTLRETLREHARSPQDHRPRARRREGIGVAEVAKLGTTHRALRAFLRRTERALGRGTRYSWPSLTDAAVKKLAAEWKAAQAKEAAPEK
jgi:hypothetical protein